MFKHYLASALRHLVRHKTTTIINVICLSFGLTCFAVAYGLTQYYSHGDLYHEKADRTFVLTQRNEFADASTVIESMPISGWGLAQILKTEYPEIEIVARALRSEETVVAAADQNAFKYVSYADPEFLEVFDLPFIAGDKRAALRTPRSAVITADLANQLFRDTNVLGKALLLSNRETVTITGVIGTPRQPSHISTRNNGVGAALGFQLLVSMDTRDALLQATTPTPAQVTKNRFFEGIAFTYLVFPEKNSSSIERVRADLSRFSESHVPKEFGRATFGLRPASEIWSALGDFMVKSEKTGITNSFLTLTLGSLVLLVSCLNYANLASAQAMTRLKETALQRVMGAGYWQILLQSFAEALLLVVAAALISMAMLPIMFEALRVGMGFDIGSVLYSAPSFWIGIAAVLITVALLASSYPAWIASRIRPAHALQSGRLPITRRRAMNTLVVFQFFAASFLFVATSVMNSQNEMIRRAPVGTQDDQIVAIDNNVKATAIDIGVLQDELRRHPAIASVSATDSAAGTMSRPLWIVRASADAAARSWIVTAPMVDYDFFATMGIKLLAGRDFKRNEASDQAIGYGATNVIIDRAMANEYGWSNPQDAIGKSIYFPSSALKGSTGFAINVIGVAENEGLYPIGLMGGSSTVYRLKSNEVSSVLVRISQEHLVDGVSAIDSTWKKLAPNVPMRRAFLNERFDAVYKQVSTMTAMFRILAYFSMFIGAMGLVLIATYAMAQRKFEIGVRRTLGASARQVLLMLLKDFSKPILIANLFAWPFAFVIAKAYSSAFAQKVAITPTPFVAGLALALAIAWLAILRQATSAARMSPSTVLRHD